MSQLSLTDVRAAADRLAGVAHRTPVLTSRTLDERVGAQVFLKAENFQRIGAFKFRGAYNAICKLSPEQLDRLEPWFVALAVVQLAVPPGRPSPHLKPGTPPLDLQIGERARAQGTPVEALEPILDHLQVMSRMPRSEGVAMVEEALTDPEANRDAIAGLIGAYAVEDDRPILKAFGKLVRRKPALAERLIFRRNDAWCERLMRWLPDGKMFVAAGGFHMLGERGLVALLRQRGYRVERVRPARATAARSLLGDAATAAVR